MLIYKPKYILSLDPELDFFAVMSNIIFNGYYIKFGGNMSIYFDSGKRLEDWQIRKIYNIPFNVNNFYNLLK